MYVLGTPVPTALVLAAAGIIPVGLAFLIVGLLLTCYRRGAAGHSKPSSRRRQGTSSSRRSSKHKPTRVVSSSDDDGCYDEFEVPLPHSKRPGGPQKEPPPPPLPSRKLHVFLIVGENYFRKQVKLSKSVREMGDLHRELQVLFSVELSSSDLPLTVRDLEMQYLDGGGQPVLVGAHTMLTELRSTSAILLSDRQVANLVAQGARQRQQASAGRACAEGVAEEEQGAAVGGAEADGAGRAGRTRGKSGSLQLGYKAKRLLGMRPAGEPSVGGQGRGKRLLTMSADGDADLASPRSDAALDPCCDHDESDSDGAEDVVEVPAAFFMGPASTRQRARGNGASSPEAASLLGPDDAV